MKKYVFFIAIAALLAGCGKEKPAMLGKKFIEIGDYENALVVFEKAVLQYPQDAELRFEMGKAYARLDEERKARQQFVFAARIGSKTISDSFLTWGKEDSTDFEEYFLFDLALTANPKNIDAVFEKSRFEIRYIPQYWMEKQKSLSDLAGVLRKKSDDYTVEGAFETLKNNKNLLFNAYAHQLTNAKNEDFGPAALSPDGKEMIWVAAERDKRRNTKYLLCRQALADTLVQTIREIKSWAAFPSYLPDSVTIIFADNGKIFKRNLNTEEEQFLCNGYFPAASSDGKNVVYTKNGDIYIVSIDDGVNKSVLADRTFKTLPRFSSDGSKIYFLGEDRDNIVFTRCDTSGQKRQVLMKMPIYYWNLRNRPALYCFDMSPNDSAAVFNIGKELIFRSIADSSVSGTKLSGRYPRFSADGRKIISILDTPASEGELWMIDMPAYDNLDALLIADEPDRKGMIKLLDKVTKGQS